MNSIRKYSALDLLQFNTPEHMNRVENGPLKAKFHAIAARCQEIMPSTLKENNQPARCNPAQKVSATPSQMQKKKPSTNTNNEAACCDEAKVKQELVATVAQKEQQKQMRKKKNYLRRKRARHAKHTKKLLELERLNLADLIPNADEGIELESATTSSDSSRSRNQSESDEHAKNNKENNGFGRCANVVITVKVAELTEVRRLKPTNAQQPRNYTNSKLQCNQKRLSCTSIC